MVSGVTGDYKKKKKEEAKESKKATSFKMFLASLIQFKMINCHFRLV
jgi:hypothetical protein